MVTIIEGQTIAQLHLVTDRMLTRTDFLHLHHLYVLDQTTSKAFFLVVIHNNNKQMTFQLMSSRFLHKIRDKIFSLLFLFANPKGVCSHLQSPCIINVLLDTQRKRFALVIKINITAQNRRLVSFHFIKTVSITQTALFITMSYS